jgi:aubergine-like protein
MGINIFSDKKKVEMLVYSSKTKDGNVYDIVIKYSNYIDPSSIKDINSVPQKLIDFLNKQVKAIKKGMGLFEYGRSQKYFNMADKKNIKGLHLDILTGYTTSFKLCENEFRILVNSCNKILREETINVIISKNWNDQTYLEKTLIGKRVIATYGNNRIYKVTGIDFDQSPQSKFSCQGEKISYVNYYNKNYHIKIRDMNQPLLAVESDKDKSTIYLIPELFKLTGIPDYIKRNRNSFKEISNYTQIDPNQRMNNIANHNLELNKYLEENQEKTVSHFTFSNDTKLKALRLHPPSVKIRLNQVVKPNSNGLFKLETLQETRSFAKWTFVYPKDLYYDAENLCSALRDAGDYLGIKVSDPLWCEVAELSDFNTYLKDPIYINNDTQFVFILFYEKDDLYHKFKRFCFHEKPIPSQVVCQTSLRKDKIMSVASKIVIQINAKLGSSLWNVDCSGLNLPNNNIMVIGADVYHNTQDNRQSVIGICASFNSTFTKYYSRVKFQAKGKEVMENISSLIEDCLKFFFKSNNNSLPGTIIFYRDGVGESQ